jgi:phage gp36-like protein
MAHPYSSIDDVYRRFPMISTMVGSDVTRQIASADISSIYISASDSIIDAYLARRYVTPLTVEPLLTDLSADISIYKAFEDKLPRYPDAVLRRYTNAMSLLTMLANGFIQLTSSQIVSSGGDQDAWTSAASNAGIIFHPAEEITNTQSIFDPFFNLDRRSF